MKQASVSSDLNFQPRQIVCLDHENACLYAEVIQMVTKRQACWVRPLMLVVSPADANLLQALPEQLILYNLHQSSDLVWPVILFRPALDTEVIPLLTQLANLETQPEDDTVAQQQFSRFIRQVWEARQRDF